MQPAHMQALFEREIIAWQGAQQAGLTMFDHVPGSGVEMATPASDDELELVSLADDDSVEERTSPYRPRVHVTGQRRARSPFASADA